MYSKNTNTLILDKENIITREIFVLPANEENLIAVKKNPVVKIHHEQFSVFIIKYYEIKDGDIFLRVAIKKQIHLFSMKVINYFKNIIKIN